MPAATCSPDMDLILTNFKAAMQSHEVVNDIAELEVFDLLRYEKRDAALVRLRDNCTLITGCLVTTMKVPSLLNFFYTAQGFQFETRESHETMKCASENGLPVKEILQGMDAALKLIWYTLCNKSFRATSTVKVCFGVKVLHRWLATGFPDASKSISYMLASYYGHEKIVKLLLNDEEANPAVANNYAICQANENGYARVAELLLADQHVNPAADEDYAIC